LSSRAFHNDVFGRFAEYITSFFGFDMVLPMNTGAEGVETAMKLARKWAHMKKGMKQDPVIVCAEECFHGRTFGAISLSTDPEAREGYQPFLPGIARVPFNDIPALKKVLEEKSDSIAAFLVEPVQGEAGYCRYNSAHFVSECTLVLLFLMRIM